MGTNQLPSRFALGDKVIAGNFTIPEDIEGVRRWHNYPKQECEVAAVTFRPGKVGYTVRFSDGKEFQCDSVDVEPVQA